MDRSDIRKGLKVTINDHPYVIIDFELVKPRKGPEFTRVKIQSLVTGILNDHTYKWGDNPVTTDIEECELQYTYPEGRNYVFMNAATGEQISVPIKTIGDDAQWLSDGLNTQVTMFKGQPVKVSLPPSVVLQVLSCEPEIKDDTASGATKLATLSTGAVIKVPLFVQEGEWVKVDTSNGTYLELVKKI